jgi:hypothetical protein
MPKAKQLSISVKNHPGALAHVASILGDAKVNILAFCATATDGEGAVHAVVDNINKAKKALERAGLSYTESDVLYVELSNAIGSLGKFAEKLAVQEISVTSAYATATKGSRKASFVAAVSDLATASRIR